MARAEPQAPKPLRAPGTHTRPKATASSRYLLPLATAVLVGACFLIYYLTYVQQHREYLLNRDYRVLATMGEQMSETVANQRAILTSYVNSFENSGFDETENSGVDSKSMGRVKTMQRILGERTARPYQLEGDVSSFGRVPLGDKSAMIHAFAPRLNHITIRHIDTKRADPDRINPAC
jgi:hypothetical protein